MWLTYVRDRGSEKKVPKQRMLETFLPGPLSWGKFPREEGMLDMYKEIDRHFAKELFQYVLCSLWCFETCVMTQEQRICIIETG